MSSDAVSIDRTSLGLSPLLVSDDGTGTFSLTDVGLGRPETMPRITYAGTSPWLHGSTPVSAVRDNSTLPMQLLVQAASTSALDAAMADLDAALWQFEYLTTTAHDGKVWRCWPAAWNVDGGNTIYARRSGFLEVVNITIPVYPIPGS